MIRKAAGACYSSAKHAKNFLPDLFLFIEKAKITSIQTINLLKA